MTGEEGKDSGLEADAQDAYERWKNSHPDAARALEELGTSPSAEEIAEWERTYPDAVAGQVLLTLYSPEVVRKMRLHDPEWRPPE